MDGVRGTNWIWISYLFINEVTYCLGIRSHIILKFE